MCCPRNDHELLLRRSKPAEGLPIECDNRNVGAAHNPRRSWTSAQRCQLSVRHHPPFRDLRMDVITRSSNGYSGHLEKLSRAEPDPALFRPPADYRVIDEPAPLTMTIRLQ